MSHQHTHKSTPFSAKKFPLIIISDGLQSPANIGALFRICDAFGVSEIVFCNASVNLNSSRLQRTSRNTHLKVPFRISEDIISEIDKLRSTGYKAIALEITDMSIPLEEYSLNSSEKIALIIGNENTGISKQVLQVAEDNIHITMFGQNSSMNVIQATSIALYALTKY